MGRSFLSHNLRPLAVRGTGSALTVAWVMAHAHSDLQCALQGLERGAIQTARNLESIPTSRALPERVTDFYSNHTVDREGVMAHRINNKMVRSTAVLGHGGRSRLEGGKRPVSQPYHTLVLTTLTG